MWNSRDANAESSTEEFNVTVSTVTAATFSSGGNMNTARRAMSGGAGTSTAGLVAGGYISDFSNATEEYDGSSWTNGGIICFKILCYDRRNTDCWIGELVVENQLLQKHASIMVQLGQM